jgi:hypothetical protein
MNKARDREKRCLNKAQAALTNCLNGCTAAYPNDPIGEAICQNWCYIADIIVPSKKVCVATYEAFALHALASYVNCLRVATCGDIGPGGWTPPA